MRSWFNFNYLNWRAIFSVDVYSFLHSSYAADQSGSNETTLADIVEKSGANNAQGQGLLRGVYAAKICCALSQKADELFRSAALRLSLPGLCSFMTELCKASHAQVRFILFDVNAISTDLRMEITILSAVYKIWGIVHPTEEMVEEGAGNSAETSTNTTASSHWRSYIKMYKIWTTSNPHYESLVYWYCSDIFH